MHGSMHGQGGSMHGQGSSMHNLGGSMHGRQGGSVHDLSSLPSSWVGQVVDSNHAHGRVPKLETVPDAEDAEA